MTHLYPCLQRPPSPLSQLKTPLSILDFPLSRRNQNYLDILRLLSLGDRQLNAFDISLRFTHLFWFGDLNYRLDMDIQVQAGPRGWLVGCPGRESDGLSTLAVAQGKVSSLCVLTPGDPELHQQEGV